jgi:hypothetical protein
MMDNGQFIPMDDGLPDILERCLDHLERGATLEECLVAFPAQRADLEPALRAAAQVRALPRPAMPEATRASLETRMLAAAAQRRVAFTPARPRTIDLAAILAGVLRAIGYRGSLQQAWLRPAALIATVVLALMLSAGTFAAARAIVEAVRARPTATPTALPTGAPTPRPLDGTIEEIAQERWVVAGEIVSIAADTEISGTPALGATAHISGTVGMSGTFVAHSIVVAAAPTEVPTATSTAIPTAVPTATSTAVPTATSTAIPTAVPAAIPTAAPAAAPPPPAAAPTQGGDNQDHTCQGQQRGRDEKKCDPKPKPEPPKPKPPKNTDKPKVAKPKNK